MTLSGIRITRFADGKTVEMWRNEDVFPVLTAMGLFPAFPEFAARDREFRIPVGSNTNIVHA